MRIPTVTPVDASRDFKIDEMFFSTTDPKGIIRSGNEVFARVSGHEMKDLLGQPHNLIRHPDMPRVVFRLLWASLHANMPIAALVKNLAKDGRYYWVVALITPVPGGYLSVRFKPSSPISTKLQEIYARMRAAEVSHGDAGVEGRAGMDAAELILGVELGRLGFADYASFMWKFLHEEIKSRDALTGGVKANAAVTTPVGASEAVALLGDIHEGAAQAYVRIDSLYQRLDELTMLHDQLAAKSASVFDHTLNIRFVALSTTIKAAKLGDEGRGLGVIAQYLGDASSRTSGEVQKLAGHIADVSAELHTVIFNLAGARLQLEMMLFFGRELLQAELAGRVHDESAAVPRQAMIAGLQLAFHATMVRAVDFLTMLGKHLNGLNAAAHELSRTILTLRVAQLGGKVEASRIRDDDSIMALLSEIHVQIEATDRELKELDEINGRFSSLIRAVPAIAEAIDHLLDRIQSDVQQLSTKPSALVAPAVTPEPPVKMRPRSAPSATVNNTRTQPRPAPVLSSA